MKKDNFKIYERELDELDKSMTEDVPNEKHIHPPISESKSKEERSSGLDAAACSASSFSLACKDLAKHLRGLREAYNSGGDVLKSYLCEYHRLNQICKDEYAATHGVQ